MIAAVNNKQSSHRSAGATSEKPPILPADVTDTPNEASTARADLGAVQNFLLTPTPDAWLDWSASHLPELLIDHANCEKKAASNALSLMYRYVDAPALLQRMSRLAREELRHFEQVLDLMDTLGVVYRQLSSGTYAQRLHKEICKQEPQRLVDHLVCGAVVEARSCERFARLIDVVPAPAADLYRRLLASEARHFQDYLGLARDLARARYDWPEDALAEAESAVDALVDARIAVFLALDAEQVNSTSVEFRFHSGVPG